MIFEKEVKGWYILAMINMYQPLFYKLPPVNKLTFKIAIFNNFIIYLF